MSPRRIKLKQWWRERRRQLGLAIYGNPTRPLFWMRGGPPLSEREAIRLSKEEWNHRDRATEGDPYLSPAERDYWEKLGVHIYWAGDTPPEFLPSDGVKKKSRKKGR